ncbi:hypothetical protein BX616_003665 [Lobosporangium transversale]|uniref:Uncharacterized protein n=1 Tax=Lobosporangium transversale TaxID=64571 RepID=A0A1Y2GPR5_9FUNG|nr:hypothetical protein BCR41DRAFT_395529 [Lobosporangium transversale]KAF9898740.1 hypothetical protein BX616_003665 [Lobosporangium transversale]ORZ18279.1 hypothetical protein BCR41DRAFT_395529 [Lobosporangium transversale]|eukprot:XP_021882074.1 hypothetical protein BCR41DRAFT_395529 [Lobosporangium transversale]
MGILDPFCYDFRQHHLYGIAVAPDYTDFEKKLRYILIKSNTDPPSAQGITWTVVSSILLSEVYDLYRQKEEVQCVVDDKGVFTLISPTAYTSASSAPVLAGIQYSPLYPPSPDGNNTGPGGWKNIDFQLPYKWNDFSSLYTTLYITKDLIGKNVVVHTWIGAVQTLHFGTLDNTSLRFQQGPSWILNSTLFDPQHATYLNENLFILSHRMGRTGVKDTVSIITAPLPDSNIPPTAPSPIRGFGPFSNITANGANFSLAHHQMGGSFGDTYYFVYEQGGPDERPMWLVTMNMANVSEIKDPKSTKFSRRWPIDATTKSLLWQTVGGSSEGPAFALVHTTSQRNASRYYGFNLNGPSIGQWYNVTHSINVTDSFGKGIGPTPTDLIAVTIHPSGNVHSTGPSTGLIIGLVIALLAVLGSLGSTVYYRWRTAINNSDDSHNNQNGNRSLSQAHIHGQQQQ